MRYEIRIKNPEGQKIKRYEAKSAEGVKKLLKMAADMGGELYDSEGVIVAESPSTEVSPEAKVQLLIDAINAEWGAIRSYESMRSSFSEEEREVWDDIILEEKVHVGQFQAMMDKYSSTTESVQEGETEGRQQSDQEPSSVSTEDYQDEDLIAEAKFLNTTGTKVAARAYETKKKRANVAAPIESVEKPVRAEAIKATVSCGACGRGRASIQDVIDDGVITEEEARQAYALGLADALKEDVELDLSFEIEVDDVRDHDSVEQAIYDLGTADGEELKDDEAAEDDFDDDIEDMFDSETDEDFDYEDLEG